jgi:hypothetical protein
VRNRLGFCLAALVAAFFSLSGHAGGRDYRLVLDRLDIEADRVSLAPGFKEALLSGRVRFYAERFSGQSDNAVLHLSSSTVLFNHVHLAFRGEDELLIEANRMFFDAEHKKMHFTNFHLRAPSIPTLDITGKSAACSMGTCILRQTESSFCPHADLGFHLNAKKLVIYPSGAADIEDIVVSVNDKPVTGLPWIHLRPRGRPGFLAPQIGYTDNAGLILGPRGLIPLDNDSFLEGGASVRSKQGFETESLLRAEDFDLKINQLFILPKNLMRIRMNSKTSYNDFSIISRIDWLKSDRRMIDESAVNYLDRAITHTSSRIVLSRRTNLTIQEAAIDMIQSFGDEDECVKASPLSPTVSLVLSLPTTPIGGHFFISADAAFVHRGGLGVDEESAVYNETPSHSRLHMETGLSHLRKAGPFSISLDLKMRGQQWVADDRKMESPNLLVFGGALSVSMPMFRDYKRIRHILSPMIRYRITPARWGRTPNYVADNYDLLRTGHGVEVGFATSIGSRERQVLRLELFERIALSGFQSFQINGGPSYLAVRGAFGPSDFQASLDGAWDQQNHQISVIGFSLHRASSRSTIDVGFRRLAPGQGPHLDQPFSTNFLPWTASSLFDNAEELLEVFQFGETPLSETLSLIAGARGEVHPNLALHALWYGLRLHSRCECISASIIGSHRVSNPVPDVFMTFELNGM